MKLFTLPMDAQLVVLIFAAVLVNLSLVNVGDDEESNKKRDTLWKELRKAHPSDSIDVYAENPALTEIAFRSNERNFLFSSSDGKIREVEPPKKIDRINCITFQKDKNNDYWWIFWHDGVAELSTKADKAGAADKPADMISEANDKNRAALWAGLRKAFPNDPIDVYAENQSLTEVAFRSKSRTMRFFLKEEKALRVRHMKGLGKINRITFNEETRELYSYYLWNDSQVELSIAAGK